MSRLSTVLTIAVIVFTTSFIARDDGAAAAHQVKAMQSASSGPYICPPCGSPCDTMHFDGPGTCPTCGMQLVPLNDPHYPTVAILLFDGVEIIDYAGPWEIFGAAGFKTFTVAGSMSPVKTVYGSHVVPDYTFANCPDANILLVPGGGVGRAQKDSVLMGWLNDRAAKAEHVMSVCTGAFILAKAGLLDGLAATTVAGGIEDLAKAAPKARVVHDKRYVDNGKIITTAGLSSGMDGALHLVGKILGNGEAQKTALGLEYQWQPDTKFARAALADRYLPNFLQDANMLSTEGDRNHWSLRAQVKLPASIDSLFAVMQSEIVTKTPHTRTVVQVKRLPGPKNGVPSGLAWTFTDDEGGAWKGTATVEPAKETPGQFVVTLRLARS